MAVPLRAVANSAAKKLGEDLGVRSYLFDTTLREDPADKEN